MLHRAWDFNIEEKESEFKDDLREASGIGRKKKKKSGRQYGPTLSHQVRALIGEGNQAYVDNDLPGAIRIMQEVIRIEPRASSAWAVLAQCYADTGEPQKALQLRIMAAHLKHDAEEWDRLANQSRDLGYNQQALYCYSKLYSLDPTNVDALWGRASLAKEMCDLRTARHSYLAILKHVPHNITVLTELRPILIELSELALCASLYQDALSHHQTIRPLGHAIDPELNDASTSATFGFIEILVLADLYNTMREHERAIDTIRRGCRWLQGRASQKFWDMCEDDREYDLPNEDGDTGVPQRLGDVQPGMYPLDVNARHRLAIARIKLGEVDEGKMHANVVLSQDILDYAALFGEIADAFFELEMYADAGPIYEMLGADPATSGLYILLQVAICRRMQGDLREAAEVYKQVIEADPMNNDAKMKLAELYEIMDEPRKALELVYQVIDSRKRKPAHKADGPSDSSEAPQGASLFEEKSRAKVKAAGKGQGRLSLAQLRELEELREKDVMQGYKRIEELWPMILEREPEAEAEREWMLEAEKLVEMFRETRNLFLTTRNFDFRGMFPKRAHGSRQQSDADEDRMASRLELIEQDKHIRKNKDSTQQPSRVDNFRGVSFENWLRIFMQYAFMLAKRHEHELAGEVLRHILLSNAYRSRDLQDTIRLAIISCALFANNYSIVVEQCRKLITGHQFNNEPHRILLATLASGLRSTDSFISSTLQKHILRELRLQDAATKTPESLKWSIINRRYTLAAMKNSDGVDLAKANDGDEGLDDEGDEGAVEDTVGDKKLLTMPTKNNPVPVALYGQITLAAKSYQSALFYLLHAFEYFPDDPVICLCLGIASLGRAMQRQSDNRHHLVTQGMAFLSRYRNLRKSFGDQEVAEIEFNFGRAFQQLGLHSHAVKHYERVLKIAEDRANDMTQDVLVVREAAYNLSLIYVTTGALPLAEALYQRWLSV
ncbi:TPR-like protein [Leucogyrophana mollusca]|uniref:TPR-like protein n=1 Tax=Leucogyrophana mollusca TaxID=85980 RepID=A0ACB8BQ95_9AGAM|nr:TPR-like protein [Leucogyrophana mollusca]